jgi:hypothetical protein
MPQPSVPNFQKAMLTAALVFVALLFFEIKTGVLVKGARENFLVLTCCADALISFLVFVFIIEKTK